MAHLTPVWHRACTLVLVGFCASLLWAAPARSQAPPTPTPAHGSERRLALVIGNTAYRNLPRLANAANDARLMADTLKALGFTLVGGAALLDLDKPGFDRAVRSFGQELQNADVGLFYYAGHGLQVQGTNWLVPVDANPTATRDLDFQMADADLVLKQMQLASTRLNLMILDACRNNPFAGRGLRAAGGGLAEMRAPEGTLIAYSTQPGNVAADGDGANSVFTAALASTLRQPGLDVFRVFNSVGLAVKRQTGGQQQPWMSSSPIDGEFFFSGVGRDGAAAPVAADPDLVFWQSIAGSRDPADFRAYLQQFPQGRFAELARARAGAAPEPPPRVVTGRAPVTPPGDLLALLQPPRPSPSRPAADEGTLLYNASTWSLSWLRGTVLRSHAAYVGQFDPDRGPTGRERDADFTWQLDSRGGPALDSLRRVLAWNGTDRPEPIPFSQPNEAPFGTRPPPPAAIPPGTDAEALRQLAGRYVEAADEMIAAATAANAYYRNGDWRDDGMARGRAMHGRLMAAYRGFMPVAEALQLVLWRVEPAARERHLAGLPLARQGAEAARQETIRRGRDLVQFYAASVRDGGGKARPADAPGMGARVAAVEQAHAEYERLRSRPESGMAETGYVYGNSYASFLRVAKEVWRAQRDRAEPITLREHQSGLVGNLNSMIFTARQE